MTPATSLRRRLLATFGLLAALILVVGATGAAGVVVTGRSYDRTEEVAALQEANARLLQVMTDAETGVRGFRLSRSPEFLEPYTASKAELPALITGMLSAAPDPRLRRLLAAESELAQTWFSVYADPQAALSRGVDYNMRLEIVAKGDFDRLRAANAAADQRLRQLSARAAHRAAEVQLAATVLTAASVVVCLLAGLVVGLRSSRTLVRPLRSLQDTVSRLTAGRHDARAPLYGPSEVVEVAQSVNALADESDLLRYRQAEAERLRQLARDVGRQIRDHVDVADLVAEAAASLGVAFDVGRVYVRMVRGDALTAVDQEWTHPRVEPDRSGGPRQHARLLEWAHRLYSTGTAFVSNDVDHDPEFDNDWGRSWITQTGARTVLTAPFGDGAELLGTITLVGVEPGRPWSEAQTAAVLQIAADLARGIVHARQYGQQQQLVERLRELDRTKTDFISTVSHELRTPLTSISGYLELIREGDAGTVSPQMEQMLAVIDRNTGRLKALIEDLLTLSRIESGAFKVSTGEVALAPIVQACADAIRPAAAAAGLVVRVDPGDPSVTVEADRNQLERAVLNLLSNAVKFTPAGGRIRVRGTVEGSSAVLEVSDTGMGIPAAEQDRLYSRFFRATNAVDGAIQGTGLGLTIVRSIVEHHHGRLDLRSQQDVGTVVRITLPLLEHPPEAAPAGGTSPGVPALSGILS